MIDNELDTQWLKDVRQSMDNYTEELPDDGWKAIVADADAKACPQVSRHETRRLFRPVIRWSIAAACVMAFSVWCGMPGGYEKLDMQINGLNGNFQQSASGMRAALGDALGLNEYDGKYNETSHVGSESVPHVRLAKVDVKEEKRDVEVNSVDSADDRSNGKVENNSGSGEYDKDVDGSDNVVVENVSPTSNAADVNRTTQEEERDLRPVTRHDEWSLGLHVGGSGSAGGDASGFFMEDSGVDWGEKVEVEVPQDNVVGSDDHMSFGFGVSVGYGLTDKLSVVSGLVYTRLTSTVEMSLTGKKDQTLNYLGLPIGLQYDIIEYNRWTLYCGSMVTMEKCVGARRGDDKINVRGLQCSMSAAAGCQYTLFGHLAIYIEPGVKWFVNDHADVPSIRTEHPCSFNMMMGIRWNY